MKAFRAEVTSLDCPLRPSRRALALALSGIYDWPWEPWLHTAIRDVSECGDVLEDPYCAVLWVVAHSPAGFVLKQFATLSRDAGWEPESPGGPWHLEHRRFQLLAEMDRKEQKPTAEAHYARSLSSSIAQERASAAARILSVLIPLAIEHKGIDAITEYHRFVAIRARTSDFCDHVASHLRYQLNAVDPGNRDIALRTLIEKLESSAWPVTALGCPS